MSRTLRSLQALLLVLLTATTALAQTDASPDSLALAASCVTAELLADVSPRVSAASAQRVDALRTQARGVTDRRSLRALRTSAEMLRFDTDREEGRLLATLDQVIEAIDAALAGNSASYAYDGEDGSADSDEYTWQNERPMDSESDDADGDFTFESDLDWGSQYDWSWRGPRRTYGSDLHDALFWREPLIEQGMPVRYNRVEGLYLGLRTSGLDVDRRTPARGVGEIGYAFGLKRLRYQIGAEARVTPRGPYAALVGVRYGRQQATYDRWKVDPVENALASGIARNDFYDYYEAQGWNVYSKVRLSNLGEVGVGFRSEDYSDLEREVSWSLFGGSGFRPNPLFDRGRAQRIVAAATMGRVQGIETLPSGAALQTEAEFGDGLGGDFAYTRLTADGRLYARPDAGVALSLRLRATHASGERIPLQALPSIGGVGSVRAYPQNAFAGRTAIVANAEIAVAKFQLFDDVADDLFVIGFADAGRADDAPGGFFRDTPGWIGAAGVALGLDDRAIRLELAWPLRDAGYGTSPTLWLRILPTF